VERTDRGENTVSLLWSKKRKDQWKQQEKRPEAREATINLEKGIYNRSKEKRQPGGIKREDIGVQRRSLHPPSGPKTGPVAGSLY